MRVAIIDYSSGNLHSAHKAFERAAREAGIASDIFLTSSPDDVARADRVVLPGVGAFADCKNGLAATKGMIDALQDAVIARGRPFLGICVGMQLMASRGLEHEITEGLGWIEGDVVALEPADPSLKIPHMGWNTLDLQRNHPLLQNLPTARMGSSLFRPFLSTRPANTDSLVARTEYGGPVNAMVARGNMAGTQFHPEKSQKLGLGLIANFLRWAP